MHNARGRGDLGQDADTETLLSLLLMVLPRLAPYVRAWTPFSFTIDEFQQYAADKGMRRFGTIGRARGRPLAVIDIDYSPVQLEDTFAAEDMKALADSA